MSFSSHNIFLVSYHDFFLEFCYTQRFYRRTGYDARGGQASTRGCTGGWPSLARGPIKVGGGGVSRWVRRSRRRKRTSRSELEEEGTEAHGSIKVGGVGGGCSGADGRSPRAGSHSSADTCDRPKTMRVWYTKDFSLFFSSSWAR